MSIPTLSKYKLLAIALALLQFLGFSQDRKDALAIIDTLCSAEMAGRGYVNNGHKKAAKFIANEMDNCGLSTAGGKYFQSFQFTANTFPSKLIVSLNDSLNLQPGIDFLVDASCPKIKGSFFVAKGFSTEDLDRKKAFLVIDLTKEEPQPQEVQNAMLENPSYRGYIFLQDQKFMWSTSTHQGKKPILFIQKKAFPKEVVNIQVDIEAKLKNIKSQNVIGLVKGTSSPDRYLLVSAHYDHLGKMGETAQFSGANDNASGIAYLLSLAKYFSAHPPPFSLLFIAFGGEEMGLVGSQHYVLHPTIPLEQIAFVLNLDIMGTGEEGITVVNGTTHPHIFDKLNEINRKAAFLPLVKKRGEAANSDHYPFSSAGVPAFFIYTLGGNPAYHDIYDLPKNLTLSHFEPIFNLLRAFIITTL